MTIEFKAVHWHSDHKCSSCDRDLKDWDWIECRQCGMKLCVWCENEGYNCFCHAEWIYGGMKE